MVAQFTVALTLLEHSRNCFELYSVCEKMKAQPKIDMKQGEQSLFAYYPGNKENVRSNIFFKTVWVIVLMWGKLPLMRWNTKTLLYCWAEASWRILH